MAKRSYCTPEGVKYPLHEAPYRYKLTIYKSDCRKAEIANPSACLIALGALRDPAVLAAYIGSGRDAYLIFKATRLRKAYALHFTLTAAAARVRDYFDTHKGTKTQDIVLSPPTAGRTLEHRAKLGKKRREEIKNGAQVKKRGKPSQTRIVRGGGHSSTASGVTSIRRTRARGYGTSITTSSCIGEPTSRSGRCWARSRSRVRGTTRRSCSRRTMGTCAGRTGCGRRGRSSTTRSCTCRSTCACRA